jgi:lipoprotein-anchoring transpeptidase ErfK/SrfK
MRRALAVRIRRPSLSLGSRGVAVRYLERRLSQLHYSVDWVNSYYGRGTRDAVLAFQKVHRMARTGRVGSGFWRALRFAHVPRPHIAHGNHIEVEKTRQVLFEVRSGRVTHVSHVSTGATGNTPVGRWHVYSKARGFNSLGMFYSLYFLRGFAIHGYHDVPPWPASHGCVRTPIWFAPRIFSRWSVGATVYVFP